MLSTKPIHLLAIVFLAFVSLAQAQHSHVHSDDEESAEEACAAEPLEEYNLSMRVGSIFIILATSAVGIFAPIILFRIRPFKAGGFRDQVLTIGKFFGTGVILATAFIHMLPEALEHFSSPCLSEGWRSYHAFAGVFCMIASFGLQLIELAALSNLDSLAKKRALTARADDTNPDVEGLAYSKVEPSKLQENVNTHEHNHDGISTDGHVHTAGFLESDDKALQNMGTLILELGILMHSIIIGITLGTTDNDEFTTLLITLVFHQFFEGIALGTRINDLGCKSWLKPTIMGSFFIVMTPIGVAIGIGIHSAFSSNSGSFVLAQAILDSLSAGILLYSAYISLMSIEINHNVAFRKSPIMQKAICFLSMYVGAGLMALLGKWA